MNRLLTQQINIGGQKIQGPLKGPGGSPINTPSDIISILLPYVIGIAAVALFFVLVWGGYDFIISQGRPEKIKSAQAKITTGIIGFVLLVASYVIVRVISQIFGVGEGLF